MTIIPWKRGRALAWDVTVWDTFTPSYLSLAASGVASIANRAETKKTWNLYIGLIHTHHFIPIGLKTLGVFEDEALAFLKELGHFTKMKTSDSQSFTYKGLVLLFKNTMLKLFYHVVTVNPFFFHAVICLGCMVNLACIDFMSFSVFFPCTCIMIQIIY